MDYEIETEADDIVTEARRLYKKDKEAWNDIYERAKEDLFFLSDDDAAQWVEKEYNERIKTGRPALTIDQLSQFVHQVVNDIRQNTPSINVIPGDEDANDETAEAFQSIIRGIEYKSNADTAYDTAASFSVKSSIGFIRVDHKYSNDYSFDQELVIDRVINPFTILIDSDSIKLDGSDAKHGHALEKMSVTEFKKRWPKKEVSCYDSDQQKFTDKDYIYVCEFFQITEEKKTIKDDKGKITLAGDDEEPKGKTREVSKKKVKRYWLSGKEVLEESTFPGKYIPLIPVFGEEAWRDGKRHLFSLIRKSKPAQMMFNLWKSLETELLLKQPQAPVMTPAGAIENYKDDWLNPNKSMALRYDQTDEEGRAYNKPERLQPPTIPTGIVNASRETIDDIKATLGMYNASLGKRGTATSGIQEKVQQQEGDTATFHFGDNLRISINHVGCVIVGAAPEIYDTDRVLMGINKEDEPMQIGINGKMVKGQEAPVDLTKGQYEVKVTTGPSFTTMRQETAANLQQLFQMQPELMQVYGDLYFKNSDFAGAEGMAERAKKLIKRTNPDIIEPDEGESPPPDPQVAQMQQIIQQGAQVLQQTQQQAQQSAQEAEQAKQQLAIQKMQDELKARADSLNAMQKIANLTIQVQEKDLENQVLKAKEEIDSAVEKVMPSYTGEQEETEEMLTAKLIALQQRKAKEQEDAQMMAALQQQEAARAHEQAQIEIAKREQDMQIKLADMERRNAEAMALISEIRALREAIVAPREVKVDENGVINGVVTKVTA